MATSGYNEADTRAKLIDPALHASQWIELVKDEERATHGEIHREQSAVRVEIIDGKPFKRGRGRVDYLLRAYVEEHEHPLTLAFVEAKKEKLPPTQGLEQVKEYARRHAVKFVYSTNGHMFVEYDATTGKTTEPRPIGEFPTATELRKRWFAAVELDAAAPEVAPLLTAYSVAGDKLRYYQDAAVRAVLERAARAAGGKDQPRALLSLATGAGKTSIAVGLLQRLSDAGRLKRALFLVDRDELREQAHTRLQFKNFFELLDKRGTPEAETEHSWTVDFAERKRKAAEEAAPHRREADTQRERATTLREQAKVLRKNGEGAKADALLSEIEAADKAAREATSKAQAIDDAVYDLKAVNPRERKVVDTRTPAQLLDAIAEKGKEVDAALERLRRLM